MWLHDMFDFEHLICVIFSLIAYSPVYAIAKFFMRKKVPQKLIFRIIIMIIVGYITLSIRYFVLGFLGIDATFIWFFSLFYGWHILFNREMDELEKGVHLSKENPALTNEEPPCVEIPSAPITPLEKIKYDELYKEMDEFEERTRLTKEDPASTNEEAPCVEIPSAPITPLEEIHLEENPTEQPTNDRASLLSQLGNLSEDELKAVVKLASALSSIKEDKQKD